MEFRGEGQRKREGGRREKKRRRGKVTKGRGRKKGEEEGKGEGNQGDKLSGHKRYLGPYSSIGQENFIFQNLM